MGVVAGTGSGRAVSARFPASLPRKVGAGRAGRLSEPGEIALRVAETLRRDSTLTPREERLEIRRERWRSAFIRHFFGPVRVVQAQREVLNRGEAGRRTGIFSRSVVAIPSRGVHVKER